MAQLSTQPNGYQAVPMEVQQQADMYNLGAITTLYKPRFTNPIVIISLAVLVLVVDIALLIAAFNAGWIVYLFLVIPILVIISTVRALRDCTMRIFVFMSGFVYVKGKKLDAVRYDQIGQVFFIARRGRYNSTSYTLTVVRSDGMKFKFINSLQYLNTFGSTVQSEVVKWHVPAALDAFKKGIVLPFGPFNLSLQGISTGQKSLPWNVVQPLILNKKGYVIVKQIGQRSNSMRVPVAQIPNLQVLLQVANYAQTMRQ